MSNNEHIVVYYFVHHMAAKAMGDAAQAEVYFDLWLDESLVNGAW